MMPEGVIRPILLPANSVNQRFSSGPAMIPLGWLFGVGTVNSVMMPAGVIRPILLPEYSANQTLPSGPAAIPLGRLSALGSANSVIGGAPRSRRSAAPPSLR